MYGYKEQLENRFDWFQRAWKCGNISSQEWIKIFYGYRLTAPNVTPDAPKIAARFMHYVHGVLYCSL